MRDQPKEGETRIMSETTEPRATRASITALILGVALLAVVPPTTIAVLVDVDAAVFTGLAVLWGYTVGALGALAWITRKIPRRRAAAATSSSENR